MALSPRAVKERGSLALRCVSVGSLLGLLATVFLCLSNCSVEQTPPPGQSDKCRDRLASASLSVTSSATPPFPGPPPSPSPTLEVDSAERWARFPKVSAVTDYWPSLSLRDQYSGIAGKVLFLAGFIWSFSMRLN